MRVCLLFLLAGCGPAAGELRIHLPAQLAGGAERIRLSVFRDKACGELTRPLNSDLNAELQREFSRGALSDTTGRSAALSLSPVPAGEPITLTAEVFGDSDVLQFEGCQEGIEVPEEGQIAVSLEIRRP